MIRDAKPDDFEILWRIDQQCFEQGISYSQEELRHYMRRVGAFTLVNEDKSGLTAFIVTDKPRRGPAHIITIDVLPRVRRSGIGTELLRAAEERLRGLGSRGVLLETAVDNEPAIRFYNRHGYSVLRVIPRYYLESIDALLMGKRLE